MAKFSTGYRNQLLTTAPARDIINLGFIKIYGGAVPATADAALGAATLLCTLSDAGGAGGLIMDTFSVDGVLTKDAAQVWQGTNVAGGVATFYRHVAVGDTGVLSTTQARIQGNIAVGNSDMNITAGTTLVNGAPNILNYYQISLPTL